MNRKIEDLWPKVPYVEQSHRCVTHDQPLRMEMATGRIFCPMCDTEKTKFSDEKPKVHCPYCDNGIAEHHMTAEEDKWYVDCQACGGHFWIPREVTKK